MKKLSAIILFIPFLTSASVVSLFNDHYSRSTNFAKPIIYQYDSSEITQLSKNKISTIQSMLKMKGFYFGRIDGKLTFRTINALEEFQTKNGIFIRDVITNDTLQLLERKRSNVASH